MFQKYGSDPTRNLFVDRVESTAKAHEVAKLDLKAYDIYKADYEGETNNVLKDSVRDTKGI